MAGKLAARMNTITEYEMQLSILNIIDTGVYEQKHVRRTCALQSGSRNCSPLPDLVL